MTDETHLSIVPVDPRGALLHTALQNALSAPKVPDSFRAQLMTRVLTDRLMEVEQRRAELELEHARALQQLRKRHVLLQWDTLAMITAASFTAGTCATLAVPWMQSAWGLPSAVTVPTLAVLIGVIAGAGVWFDRLGKPDLGGVGQH